MGTGEFRKSGAFVATVFGLVVVLLPFALEQIGETTGFFDFPVMKTVKGWFASPGRNMPQSVAAKPVDWDRYRKDLEEFTAWTESRCRAVITPPVVEVFRVVDDTPAKPTRRLWSVPVVGCTAGDPMGRSKGYVFISGFSRPYDEGAVVAPSKELCGYEIVSVGERSVWFRAVFDSEGDTPMGIVKFPAFTRVEGESLVRGSRKYVARDAFPLASGGWLMIDSFMPPDTVVFKILDESRRAVATILCVVIGEKGGR